MYDSYKEHLKKQQEEALLQQKQQESEAQKQAEFERLINEYRQKEPNFRKIYDYFPTWAGEMPAKEWQAMQAEFAKGNIESLRKWFDKCRADWYAKNKKPDPPRVEKAGSSMGSTPPKRINPRSFGDMTPEEKVKFLIEGGYVD